LGTAFYEAELVRERINSNMITIATLTQAAIGTFETKKGAKHFNDIVKRLSDA
jgi:hypothetical protein